MEPMESSLDPPLLIGWALGVLDSELKTIAHNPLLIAGGVPSYFKEMLSQWLKWAPPHHLQLMLEALVAAVQSRGHESLATNLKLRFKQKKGMVCSQWKMVMPKVNN